MAITFHPKAGTLLMCDFNTGFVAPEMIKKRPVIVVSRTKGQTVLVVPLSATEPVPFEPWHYEMPLASMPKSLRSERCWAKCDMVSCVWPRWRLDRIMDGKDAKTGRRIYVAPLISGTDYDQIRKALMAALHL